jgi:hypothetical protein
MRHHGKGIGAALLACSLIGCGGEEAAPAGSRPAPPPPDDMKSLFQKPTKGRPAPGKGAFAPAPAPGGPGTRATRA